MRAIIHLLTFVKGLPRFVVFIIRLLICCLVRVAASSASSEVAAGGCRWANVSRSGRFTRGAGFKPIIGNLPTAS